MSELPPRFRFPVPLLLALLCGLAIVIVAIWSGRSRGSAEAETKPGEGKVAPEAREVPARSDVVFLISLDGFSGSYLNPDDAPKLYGMREKAVTSTRLLPPFPSLTFPSHVTLATGRPVSGHGIPGNTFFDREQGEELRFPGDATLLRAEPIWTTAARQGLRVLSYDWPLSHNQTGPDTTTYFESRFDPSLSDQERIDRVLDLWERDPNRGPGDGPLRLITAYAKETDTVGHRHGPGAPETREAVRRVDELIAETLERAERIFAKTKEEGSRLYVLLAADHGMAAVTHNVNLDLLLGAELSGKVIATTGGNVANVYLADPASPDREDVLAAVDRAFEGIDFATLHTAVTLPAAWEYPVEGRTGERIVTLAPGHTFSRSAARVRTPVGEGGSLRGMHGYSVVEVPAMSGLFFLLRTPDLFAEAHEVGEISATMLHATVAALLGIEPAAGAAGPIPGVENW